MKRERRFTDFPHLIDLQQANNTDMGSILHSRVTVAAICEHIGNEMRKNLIKAVIDSGEKIGIMFDEATTNSTKKNIGCVFAIFLKGKPSSLFLDLIELQKADSQTILDCLLECLRKHGMDSD